MLSFKVRFSLDLISFEYIENLISVCTACQAALSVLCLAIHAQYQNFLHARSLQKYRAVIGGN